MEVPSVFSYKRRRKNERSLFERKKQKNCEQSEQFLFPNKNCATITHIIRLYGVQIKSYIFVPHLSHYSTLLSTIKCAQGRKIRPNEKLE